MFGLIGKKLGHSFSANYFNNKFKNEGIEDEYRLLELQKIEDFPELVQKHKDIIGLNVTIPYKESVIPYLTDLSEEAREIGAVNVIKFQRYPDSLRLIGYNSDAIGFKNSIIPLLREDIKSALILGTGGASKAVSYILKKLGINVTLVSRTPKEGEISYEDIDKRIMDENLLIVNATPLGMVPDTDNYPPIPYQYLSGRHICYDVIYNPEVTKFLEKAAKEGATIKNGIEMLYGQAVAAWDIWQNIND